MLEEEEDETYLFFEDYALFSDALLVATGQFDLSEDVDEVDFEIRDMTDVFMSICDIDAIFRDKYCSNWSKSTLCLSTTGAVEILLKVLCSIRRHDIGRRKVTNVAIIKSIWFALNSSPFGLFASVSSSSIVAINC